MKCFACGGLGKKQCQKCKGTGHLNGKPSGEKGKKQPANPCPHCGGAGQINCTVCGGTGRR